MGAQELSRFDTELCVVNDKATCNNWHVCRHAQNRAFINNEATVNQFVQV